MTRRPRRLPAGLAVLGAVVGAVVLAACGGQPDADPVTTTTTPTTVVTHGAAAPPPHNPIALPSNTGALLSGPRFVAQPAARIRSQAIAATLASGSFHVSGTFTDRGQDQTVDLSIDRAGDCSGTYGIGDGHADVLGVGGHYWWRPDAAMWRRAVGAQAVRVMGQVGDKWVDNGDLAALCSLQAFFDVAPDSVARHTKGAVRLAGTQYVVPVLTTNATGRSAGLVLTRAPHYVIRLAREGTESARLSLSAFGVPVDVTAPTADRQVDLDSVG